jgi:hypothetical protein
MVGQEAAPARLETDWVLGQFARELSAAQAGYAAFVRQGIEQPSVWEALRHQVYLGSEAFVERHCAPSRPAERLRAVPRAQRPSLATPLADFDVRYPVRREAMARAFQTGVYSMQEIADYFGVHNSTASRAVRRLETGQDSQMGLPAKPRNT